MMILCCASHANDFPLFVYECLSVAFGLSMAFEFRVAYPAGESSACTPRPRPAARNRQLPLFCVRPFSPPAHPLRTLRYNNVAHSTITAVLFCGTTEAPPPRQPPAPKRLLGEPPDRAHRVVERAASSRMEVQAGATAPTASGRVESTASGRMSPTALSRLDATASGPMSPAASSSVGAPVGPAARGHRSRSPEHRSPGRRSPELRMTATERSLRADLQRLERSHQELQQAHQNLQTELSEVRRREAEAAAARVLEEQRQAAEAEAARVAARAHEEDRARVESRQVAFSTCTLCGKTHLAFIFVH